MVPLRLQRKGEEAVGGESETVGGSRSRLRGIKSLNYLGRRGRASEAIPNGRFEGAERRGRWVALLELDRKDAGWSLVWFGLVWIRLNGLEEE
jgi:hypothetical protein